MSNLFPKREFEPLTIAERIERDPRGLTRVTIIGETILFPMVRVEENTSDSMISADEAGQGTIRVEEQ